MFDYSPLVISLRAAILATTLVFILGNIVARWSMGLKGAIATFVDTVLTLPLVLPPTVLGFFLLVLFGKNGPLGSLLGAFGGSVIFTWYATVLSAMVVSFPLMYRSARGAFEQVDKERIWAARTLGMKEPMIFLRIMIPEAWPGIAAGLVLSFSRALGEFGATLMIAGNIPGKTQTIPMAIYFATAGGDMKTAWVWVLVIVALSGLSLIALANFTRGRQ
ncbi:molybdate ABC transporter, permease protein [Sphaerochaeta pleomorpha str. Grapes]|uniref:Molybdenum transport system permease n=1 Tax=Sphaerochaeta pleomorpha (strain ATCC BAA-1885 / DSM 22778 / Grapes) TaxID=158190 RepID=G8QTB6_SPHPG|nr:molybdate ABC transporter permease subunit [Sphaerochaeta pleomorpha]AEV29083.1 molybdate ABC transporter, permease protein [Sphaerochaeta pleomorpha str. Grapes]